MRTLKLDLNEFKSLPERVVEWFYKKFIRPIRKARRRRAYEKQSALLNQAVGQVVNDFRPMLMTIINETVKSYESSVFPQNHWTKQCTNDIKKIYEITIENFISQKN